MSLRIQKIADVRHILCASKEQNTSNIEKAVYQYLSDTADVFPTTAIEDSVAKQVRSVCGILLIDQNYDFTTFRYW